MSYTIQINRVRTKELTFEAVRFALKDELLESEVYGDVESVTFDGESATVVMSGEIPEVTTRMNGRVYKELY